MTLRKIYIMELIFTLQQLPDAGSRLHKGDGRQSAVCLQRRHGCLSKTTFITEVCRQLGAADDSGSPTFSIVNEYLASDGKPIYHFDFYRIDSPQEALDLGAEDYFYSGHLCLMEWAERIGDLLPEETVEVSISELPRRFA